MAGTCVYDASVTPTGNSLNFFNVFPRIQSFRHLPHHQLTFSTDKYIHVCKFFKGTGWHGKYLWSSENHVNRPVP